MRGEAATAVTNVGGGYLVLDSDLVRAPVRVTRVSAQQVPMSRFDGSCIYPTNFTGKISFLSSIVSENLDEDDTDNDLFVRFSDSTRFWFGSHAGLEFHWSVGFECSGAVFGSSNSV
ncbi:hypothetical protein Hanom_Chr02g00170171 [Helianthus anomalus]